MGKKEKVSLIRAEDFEAVDLELTEALTLLEQSNAKVEALLHQEHEPEGIEIPENFEAPCAKHQIAENTPAMHRTEDGRDENAPFDLDLKDDEDDDEDGEDGGEDGGEEDDDSDDDE